jgi:hypothetical protein
MHRIPSRRVCCYSMSGNFGPRFESEVFFLPISIETYIRVLVNFEMTSGFCRLQVVLCLVLFVLFASDGL